MRPRYRPGTRSLPAPSNRGISGRNILSQSDALIHRARISQESELKIGASLGGDLVTCPECGKGMEGDLDHDEIWHCPKCGDTYGLDDDWYLEWMPTEEDIGCQQYHAWAENQGPPMTEDE